MNTNKYDQINMQRDGTKICLLFPKKEQHEEDIRKEVKAILSCALQEQLRKIFREGVSDDC